MLKWAIAIKYAQAVTEELQGALDGTIITLDKNCRELCLMSDNMLSPIGMLFPLILRGRYWYYFIL